MAANGGYGQRAGEEGGLEADDGFEVGVEVGEEGEGKETGEGGGGGPGEGEAGLHCGFAEGDAEVDAFGEVPSGGEGGVGCNVDYHGEFATFEFGEEVVVVAVKDFAVGGKNDVVVEHTIIIGGVVAGVGPLVTEVGNTFPCGFAVLCDGLRYQAVGHMNHGLHIPRTGHMVAQRLGVGRCREGVEGGSAVGLFEIDGCELSEEET